MVVGAAVVVVAVGTVKDVWMSEVVEAAMGAEFVTVLLVTISWAERAVEVVVGWV